MDAIFRPQRSGSDAVFGKMYGEGGGVVILDPEAPVMVGSLSITTVGTRSVTVEWLPATDNMAVVGYQISVDTGVPSYSLVGNSLSKLVVNLMPSTSYTVRVRAMDASNNVSTALTTTVTTAQEIQKDFVPILNKAGEGVIVDTLAVLSTVPISLDYVKNRGQELVLYNNGLGTAVVNLAGSAATNVYVKGAAGSVIDLTKGLDISVPAGTFVTLKLDNANAYLKGNVTLRATANSYVFAGVLQ